MSSVLSTLPNADAGLADETELVDLMRRQGLSAVSIPVKDFNSRYWKTGEKL